MDFHCNLRYNFISIIELYLGPQLSAELMQRDLGHHITLSFVNPEVPQHLFGGSHIAYSGINKKN